MPHRVVVTGFGCVSPLGLSVAETWNSLLAGVVASKNIQSPLNRNWSPQLNGTLARIPCNVFCPIDSIPRRDSVHERIKYPRSFEFVEMAAAEALEQFKKMPQNIGSFVGWGMPGSEEIYDLAEHWSNPVIAIISTLSF
jgi:3-oxoacyl-(acyl-carrier-protein) synthase